MNWEEEEEEAVRRFMEGARGEYEASLHGRFLRSTA